MPLREKPVRKFPVRPVISSTVLALAVLALLLMFHKPRPVATRQSPTALAENAQSFQSKLNQLEDAKASGQQAPEIHLSSGEISAAIAQSAGTVPVNGSPNPSAPPMSTGNENVGSGDVNAALSGEPVISFEGDEVKGQFVAELAGKKVYVTVNGHLGAKDGYATFQPTQFKIGDLEVPVSLVNDALQKRLQEQRDRLKLPEYINDVKVQNGELVVTPK